MLGVGTTALISHAAGRKEHDRARLLFNQSLVLSILVGILYLGVAMWGRVAYARLQSADATTARLAADYLAWFIPATALQFAMVSMGAALRGTGNFKPGMVVQTATVVINIVLAPFLMFGWITHHPMGVLGAALATFIAVAIGSLWLLLYFLPVESYLRFSPADWRPQPALWGKVLAIGLPSGAEFALMGVYVFIIYAITRPFGAAAQAGFGIGMRVVQAGFMPVVALGFAVAPVAGQNFGARLPARVRETFRMAAFAAVIMMSAFAVLTHLATEAMIRVFSRDPQVVAVGVEYLRIVSWNYVASGVIFVAASMFQALGNTVPSLVASFIRLSLIAVPAVVLSRLPGFRLGWIWLISVLAVTIQLILSLLLLAREFRRRLGVGAAEVPAPGRNQGAAEPAPGAIDPDPLTGAAPADGD
ncbi:MAG: MATE family efflux transporter [Candidatus Rokubacteria bacterium]|nr:MATE family efflux transporter [Candidatus Rokubacteria bacterium]